MARRAATVSNTRLDAAPAFALTRLDDANQVIRRDDLLGWLGQRLQLVWIELPAAELAAAAAPAAPARPTHEVTSGREFEPLLELVRLGYYKGIVQWLDEWVQDHPEQAAFAQQLRTLAREFRFDAIEQQLLQRHV